MELTCLINISFEEIKKFCLNFSQKQKLSELYEITDEIKAENEILNKSEHNKISHSLYHICKKEYFLERLFKQISSFQASKIICDRDTINHVLLLKLASVVLINRFS